MGIIIPPEINEILNRPATRLELIDSLTYVQDHNLPKVTSPNVFEPNSMKFHPQGLFSEEIFGSITSMDRFVNEAIITLNTTIIHPRIFATNIQPKSIYTSIMSGKQFAIFDEETHSFELASSNTPGANTGYQFFISHIHELGKGKAPTALRASNTFKLLSKYNDRLTISDLICLPAGLRDLDLKSARLSKDDINKLYMAVINLTTSLSSYRLSEDKIFDGIRYQIQIRVGDVHDYIMNVISGKGGFFQKHYGARKIAYSTRNVISVPISEADTPDDPSNIKADETMVPMLNTIKSLQPFFTHYVLKKLYGEIFVHGATENVAVTNPATQEIEYVVLKPAEVNRYTTSDGVNRIINQFKHVGFRESPIAIWDNKGKMYWLLLCYSIKDKVYIAKTKTDLEQMVVKDGEVFGKKDIQPLRWVEALYLASVQIASDKHNFITRYPALEDGSIYPSKMHIITTNPSKMVEVVFDSGLRISVPHYPIIVNPYHESLIVHQCRLQALSADFDGDIVSNTATWSKEGNDDINDNMESISSVVGADMKLKLSSNSDIVNLAIFNLSRQDIQR